MYQREMKYMYQKRSHTTTQQSLNHPPLLHPTSPHFTFKQSNPYAPIHTHQKHTHINNSNPPDIVFVRCQAAVFVSILQPFICSTLSKGNGLYTTTTTYTTVRS